MIDKKLILATESNPVQDEIASHYQEIIRLLGENTQREGLLKTPHRVAKAMQFMTYGYQVDPKEILKSAMFQEEYQQMVIVRDIDFYSMCCLLYTSPSPRD